MRKIVEAKDVTFEPRKLEYDVFSKPTPNKQRKPGLTAVMKNYLQIADISCIDSKGRVFEHYDQLRVNTDVECTNKNNSILVFKTEEAIIRFEYYHKNCNAFLPSAALTCNILAVLYANRDEKIVEKTILQYKDHGQEIGYHAQNTLIDWDMNQIIHYPSKEDFEKMIYEKAFSLPHINAQKARTTLEFDNSGFPSCSRLDESLANPNCLEFVQNLTGLQNPEILIEIGDYFQRPDHITFHGRKTTSPVWIGCSDDDFSLHTSNDIYRINAARGVRELK